MKRATLFTTAVFVAVPFMWLAPRNLGDVFANAFLAVFALVGLRATSNWFEARDRSRGPIGKPRGDAALRSTPPSREDAMPLALPPEGVES